MAETLLEKKLAEAARLVVDLARNDATMNGADRARIGLIDAILLDAANHKAEAQKAVALAVYLDRNVEPPRKMPAYLQKLLEGERARIPPSPASTPAQALGPRGKALQKAAAPLYANLQPEAASIKAVALAVYLDWNVEPLRKMPAQALGPQGKALAKAAEVLYTNLQPEAANIVFEVAKPYEPFNLEEQEQLALWQGIVQVELLDKPGAHQSFQRALMIDWNARLPDAPPAAREIFDEEKKKLEPEHKLELTQREIEEALNNIKQEQNRIEQEHKTELERRKRQEAQEKLEQERMKVAATASGAPAPDALRAGMNLAPVKPAESWYGWQPILVDALAGVGIGLAVGLAVCCSQYESAFLLTSGGIYLLGSPLIHLFHGRWQVGAGDLLLRVVFPIAGAVVGWLVSFGTSGGSLVGLGAGAVAALLIDYASLSWAPVTQQASSSFRWVPVAGTNHGSPFAGIAGSF